MSERDDFEKAVHGARKADPYALIWTVAVVLQHDDGTVDLETDGTPFRDLTRIPYDAGVVGGREVLRPGTGVRLAFAGGTPDGAFVFGRAPDPSANKGVVRVGDHGEGGVLSVATGPIHGAPCTLTYIPPDGGDPIIGPTIQIFFKATEGSVEVFLR